MCLLLIARGQNIGALKGLVDVSEDVKYRDDTLCGMSRTSHIYIDAWLAEDWMEKDVTYKFSCLRTARTRLWERIQKT